MGTNWRRGLDRSEKELVDHVFKKEKHPTEMLRQFEKNANRMNQKGKAQCTTCLKHEDMTFPKTIWTCRKCSRKIIDSGMIGPHNIIDRTVSPNTRECEWCWNRDCRFLKLHFRLCSKCAGRFGKRDQYRDSAKRSK